MIFGSGCLSRRFLPLATAAILAGCAGLPEVQPVDIPRLQERVAASPDDTDLQVQLGIAHFKAGEFEPAEASLRAAVEAGNESGPAYLYLGMAEEELLDWSGAREAYTRYLEVGASAPARERVRTRLTLIGRNLLRAQARQALAQEQEITATGAITPQSVAVLPLAFNSERDDLEPLVYALSDMMITDFKVSNALIVLERAQIQTLLDEMALTSAGYAEAGTGARAGRLLRAEHVFQGVLTTLGGDELRTDADVLNVPSTTSIGDITETAVLEQLFDMEKQLVIRTIREVLGVELTPAEEQRILDNRVENVLAFLAYGRGLRELDNGNYNAAMTEFDLAISLEPGSFALTEVSMAEASALDESQSTSTTELAGTASASGETGLGLVGPPSATTTEATGGLGIGARAPIGAGSVDATANTAPPLLGTLTSVAEGVIPTPTAGTLGLGTNQQSRNPTPGESQPTNRDPVQELAGESGVANATAQIRIIIRRPGGDQ